MERLSILADGRVAYLLRKPRRNGATDDLRAAVEELGGSVGSVTEKLGYVRATVPTDSVADLADLTIVKAIDLNRTYRVPAAASTRRRSVPVWRASR